MGIGLKIHLLQILIQTNQIKTKNEPVPNLNGLKPCWNELSWDLNGWNVNVNRVNSSATSINTDLVDENKAVDNGDEDDWEFKDARPKTLMSDEVSKVIM